MRAHPVSLVAGLLAVTLASVGFADAPADADAAMIRRLYDAALVNSPAFDELKDLTGKFPGRLSGTTKLVDAGHWAQDVLRAQGADRTELQPVMVPHWERGPKESILLLAPEGATAEPVALTAVALGGSVPTPESGLTAPVIELHTLAELKTTDVRGKIVFFNRPMKPEYINPGKAYGEAGDARNHGPAEAAKYGAVGVLTRSLTHSLNDIPHTGTTAYLDGVPRIPAAALSTLASNHLSAALAAAPHRIEMKIHSQWLPDAPANNVIGEITGSEFPGEIIAVGGHLDCWDIAPGAHDDGAGVVESMDVLRILRAAGYRPRHTIRCVLFVNEENGTRGGNEYARIVATKKERHVLAIETDGGGDQPRGFDFGPTEDVLRKAEQWRPLFAPYGVYDFTEGHGGTDIEPLVKLGYPVAGLMPESQRYFDIHHTVEDSIDKVNPRELELGAAALASLIYLVDQHGI
ncbi:MAG TPA: M20/M25/M40 family metallo-hydrolase [Candidatus Didemnitutus sp.]|nr:M20/M25/M40 family metallo-hydrolase [Candidatus Didemnitutus sp.]